MKKEKSFIILLGGMPASGKTTLGRMIAKELKIPFFDKDLLCDDYTNWVTERETWPNDRHSDLYRNHLRDLEYQIMLKQAYEHSKDGINSICISPFTSEFQNDKKIEEIKNQALKSNSNVKVISIALILTADETKKRMIARGRKEDNDKLKYWNNYIKGKMSIKFSDKIDLILNGNDKNNLEKIIKMIKKI